MLTFTCGGIAGGIDGGGTLGGGTPGGGMPMFGGGTELEGGATVGIFGGMIGGGSEIVDDSISFLISSRIFLKIFFKYSESYLQYESCYPVV